MKTAEEIAKRYFKNGWWNPNSKKLRIRMEEAFVAGYNEAMRWKDPKNELPKCNYLMQIKYIDIFSNIINYGHDRYIEDAGMWDIEQSVNIKILAWRPL